jgi:hypothetical protein
MRCQDNGAAPRPRYMRFIRSSFHSPGTVAVGTDASASGVNAPSPFILNRDVEIPVLKRRWRHELRSGPRAP